MLGNRRDECIHIPVLIPHLSLLIPAVIKGPSVRRPVELLFTSPSRFLNNRCDSAPTTGNEVSEREGREGGERTPKQLTMRRASFSTPVNNILACSDHSFVFVQRTQEKTKTNIFPEIHTNFSQNNRKHDLVTAVLLCNPPL